MKRPENKEETIKKIQSATIRFNSKIKTIFRKTRIKREEAICI
jgi:hypothetical protein